MNVYSELQPYIDTHHKAVIIHLLSVAWDAEEMPSYTKQEKESLLQC